MEKLTRARYARALPAAVALQAALPVLASGMEGAAMVGPVRLIVFGAILILAVSLVGGVIFGVRRAHRDGESMSHGVGRGALKGILAFVVVVGIVAIVATFAGLAFIVFALFTAPLATPSSN